MFNPARLHPLNSCPPSPGGVVYWMQRDQRVGDNWALLYAQEKALESALPLQVVFCLTPCFLGASIRHYGFMLKGLQEVAVDLMKLNIPFDLITGNPGEAIPAFIRSVKAGFLVTDFNPLRLSLEWRENVCRAIEIPFVEVDAHNILPCRVISGKLEYAAFTLRKKVEKQLAEYLTEFPPLVSQPSPVPACFQGRTDREAIGQSLMISREIGRAHV